MSRKIQFKRGLVEDLPTLSVGEPGFTTDEKVLYVGSSTGNIPLAAAAHDHDARYYTKAYIDSDLPFREITALYDSSIPNTTPLYAGDVLNCDVTSYDGIEIFGKIPSSQFHIIIDLDLETSSFSVDRYEASDVVRRLNFNCDSVGAMTSVTCSVNSAKSQLKFHGAYAGSTYINGDTAAETRNAYQICKIFGFKNPATQMSAPSGE